MKDDGGWWHAPRQGSKGDTTQAVYQRALDIVGSVVREWNPYGLIRGCAPFDEFDAEIAAIVAQIPRIKTEKEAALALSRVFSSAFEAQRFRPEQCVEIGKKLFAALTSSRLVESSGDFP
jgi:hypothetical protein